MKIYNIIILASLIISSIQSGTFCGESEEDPESAEDCFKLDVKEEYDYCCFLYVKFNGYESKRCHSFTKEDYKEEKKKIDAYKNENPDDEYQLDCNSSYFLQFSVLIALLILF